MRDIIVFDTAGKQLNTLAQWDRDIHITVREVDIQEAYNVHFYNELSQVAYVCESTYVNNILDVKIPNVLLLDEKDIYGYVFRDGNDGEGQSIARFRINIRPRPRPSDFIYSETIDYVSYAEILQNCQDFAQAESARVTAEQLRVAAEQLRATAEQLRVSAEQLRADAESARVDSEDIRLSNETNRENAENNRVSAETSRVDAETSRENAETNRAAALANALGISEITINDDDNDTQYVYQLSIQDGHLGITLTET